MRDAIVEITSKRFGCVGITGTDGSLVGIITDGDLRRHLSGDLLDRSVNEIMTMSPKVVTGDVLLARAIDILNSSSITAIFVVEHGQPVGIVHLHDLLRIGVA